EYTTTNAFVRADEQTSETVVESFAAYRKSWEERMRAAGTLTGRSEMITTRGQPCRAGTWPLAPGKLTGSRDGQGVAPLLGRVSAYDESVTTGCFGFLSYLGSMCDHAVQVSYLPQSVDVTLVVLRW
ncbi:hypothetical protein, partial [Enterococcus entomosocium]|uniref:hypothetical protein n=1 Tax=Enterococcus entomosocium TaxID=3034352 RepID=UPI00264A307E